MSIEIEIELNYACTFGLSVFAAMLFATPARAIDKLPPCGVKTDTGAYKRNGMKLSIVGCGRLRSCQVCRRKKWLNPPKLCLT